MSGPAGACIHLYCDNPHAEPPQVSAPQGVHEWGEFPHVFTHPYTVSACRTKARKAGWKLSHLGDRDLCPKCNPEHTG